MMKTALQSMHLSVAKMVLHMETTVTREMLVLHNGNVVDVIVLTNQKYLMSPAMKLLHQFVDAME